jgi:DNA/RNA endonuclease YhcR with UshA esterase domain
VASIDIGAITSGHIGEDATVEGVVVKAASFPHGFRFTLEDGTGQIALVMWHEVFDDCWDAGKINLGARVRAEGAIVLYEGQWQIQPTAGAGVKAIQSASAWAPQRQIGSLGGNEAGERVMVEGRVIRVEGLRDAVKVFLGDESGEIVVFIWRDILDRVANNTALGTVGSRVRVVGALQVYRANLEVQPSLPGDVTVLEMP